MTSSLTMGKKIGGGFALIAVMALALCAFALHALSNASERRDRVTDHHGRALLLVGALDLALEGKVAATRGFLLNTDPDFELSVQHESQKFSDILAELQTLAVSEDAKQHVAQMKRLEAKHQAAVKRVIAVRKGADGMAPAGARVEATATALDPRLRLLRCAHAVRPAVVHGQHRS